MTAGKAENQLGKLTQKNWVYFNYFFIEDQISELETGEDVAIMFRKCNILEGEHGRRTLKEAFEIIGRRNISKQLEIYLAAGK